MPAEHPAHSGDDEPPAPPTGTFSGEDRRILRNIVLWLCACAFLGVLFLIFAIWIDWT